MHNENLHTIDAHTYQHNPATRNQHSPATRNETENEMKERNEEKIPFLEIL